MHAISPVMQAWCAGGAADGAPPAQGGSSSAAPPPESSMPGAEREDSFPAPPVGMHAGHSGGMQQGAAPRYPPGSKVLYCASGQSVGVRGTVGRVVSQGASECSHLAAGACV